MSTEDVIFRCRKCRHFLFTPSILLTSTDDNETREGGTTAVDDTLWFLDPEAAPDWVQQSFQKGQFLRGKFNCPKCAGRIGAFDFISGPQHGHHSPAWVLKDRVDFLKNFLLPSSRQTPVANLPIMSNAMIFPSLTSDLSVEPTSDQTNNCQASPLHVSVEASEGGQMSRQRLPVSEDRRRRKGRHVHLVDSDSDSNGGESVNYTGQDDDVDKNIEQVVISSRYECLAQSNDTQREEVDGEEMGNGSQDLDIGAHTCPICLDVYYQPHTCRPCCHVFCAPCLRRLCGATPINTKCPLCREVIVTCLPNHEMTSLVKAKYPSVYHTRNNMEKKSTRLPPLPSHNRSNFPQHNRFSFTRFPQDRNRNYVLVHWAGVCFVVLLTLMAVSVLATTIAMVVWYLWETLMDYFIDALVLIDSYFDYCWQVIIMVLLEGNISPELAKILAGSYGQVLHAVGKFFNRTIEVTKESFPKVIDTSPPSNSLDADTDIQSDTYTATAFQVDLANYILFVAIVTYLIYRFARYRQAGQAEAAVIR